MQSPPCRIVELTPPGRGAIATLRVEGPGALTLLAPRLLKRNGQATLFGDCPDFHASENGIVPFGVGVVADGRLMLGRFDRPDGEEVVVRVRSPESVELHCHGGAAVVAMIRETLMAAGCQAVPWRQWAIHLPEGDSPIFGCTKIGTVPHDRIAVEAFVALADARTERTAAILLDQYCGALSRELDAIGRLAAGGRIVAARQRIDRLLRWSSLGLHLTDPWRVVVVGRPNVGKSSLLNALAGYQRAIVHHRPGTTRDVLTAGTAVDGWPIELADTAGLRHSGDPVEQAGVALAGRWAAAADLVVLVADRSAAWTTDDAALVRRWPRALVVHNKADLRPHSDPRPNGLACSALSREGIETLLGAISLRLVPRQPAAGSPIPFTRRQILQLQGLRRQVGPSSG